MPGSAPFESRTMKVRPEWIDYNGHMNMAYYNVLFDKGVDDLFDLLGVGIDYVKTRNHSSFTAEFHICYVRELHDGDEVTVTTQILDHDEKRMRCYQEIRHTDGWLAATGEALSLHVDLDGPKVVPFPADIAAKIASVAEQHSALPMPERAGRSIAITRKPKA